MTCLKLEIHLAGEPDAQLPAQHQYLGGRLSKCHPGTTADGLPALPYKKTHLLL